MPPPGRFPDNRPMTSIRMVGFDADDTLWRSQDYFDRAQRDFEGIIAAYVNGDARTAERLYAVEMANLAVFGDGVKGMALSMIEAAIDITGGRISAADVHRIVSLAKDMLRHPVELLPGVREAVEAVAAELPVVMITKGDLFHQEAKVRDSGMSSLFRRIEIVSEKDVPTYRRLLDEFAIAPSEFVMVGNSLRSDIAPVLELGGWGMHVPYHLTWEHEREAVVSAADGTRLRTLESAAELPAALRSVMAA
jgi:putative hydrolase of the HAD superfamily